MTWTDQLLQKLSILNPELDICAIVVDEVEPAKEILKRVGLPVTLLHPFYEIKECLERFDYDYCLCLENFLHSRSLLNMVLEYAVSKNKVLDFDPIYDARHFFVERALRYYKAHATEFEMFATGLSYSIRALDAAKFRYKLFNFAHGAQDLYYDFQVAKRVVVYGGA